MTPPYDVITPEGQQRYYRRSPWNFVRVVFGKDRSTDTRKENRYTRAKRTLEAWIQSGILTFDENLSVYPYLQEYALDPRGRKIKRRWGLIALVRLDSPKVYPHEGTREEPKKDRLQLICATEASLSPIFGLIPDREKVYERFIRRACQSHRPVAEVRLDGVCHRLWKIANPTFHKRLKRLLTLKELIIADGHHRYEAALAYRDQKRAKDPSYTPHVPYNFAMFYLASCGSEDPGLLPTHRLLKGCSLQRLGKFIQELKGLSLLQPVRSVPELLDHLESLRSHRRLGLGFYCGNGTGYLLKANPEVPFGLDVEWLEKELFPPLLPSGIEVSYTQDLLQGLGAVRRGEAQALFVLNRPRLTQVLQRARRKLRMPGKTTYFYPKPLAGLVEYAWGQPPAGTRGQPPAGTRGQPPAGTRGQSPAGTVPF